MLTATDGEKNGGGGADKFRIKIWDRSTDPVVYDNQMGDADDGEATHAIGGGSIVIHSEDRGLAEMAPGAFALHQNYPNPFNPTTTIAYGVGEPGNVTLTIYTVTGQRVATVVSGYHDPGHYSISWDGSAMASGIYLYRLEAEKLAETKRMMVLK